MAEGWSKDTVDQTVVAYFDMLGKQLAGTSFVKAAVEQKLSTAIGRSTSAVGYKFSNISAILSEEGLVFLAGYRPQHNYQALLRDRVLTWLIDAPQFRDEVLVAVTAAPAGAPGELGAPKPPPASAAAGGTLVGGRAGSRTTRRSSSATVSSARRARNSWWRGSGRPSPRRATRTLQTRSRTSL